MVFQGPFQLRTLSTCLVPVLFGVACSVGSAGEAVLVSTVVDQATAAVDDLVAEGFDRLEASVSLAGSQARASVDHAASELAAVMSSTVDELDGQQGRAVSDLQRLTAEIAATLETTSTGVFTPIRQDAFLLLSSEPGYISASGGYGVRSSKWIEFELKGTALSRAELLDYQVNSVPTDPLIVRTDDTSIRLRVPLDEGPAAAAIQGSDEASVVEVPITFALEECSWFGLRCKPSRRFVLPGMILPEILGSATATFFGEVTVEERRSRTEDRFKSVHSRSGWRGNRGRSSRSFAVRPATGWRIDTRTIRLQPRLLTRECSGRRSGADLTTIEEQVVVVRVRSVTEREPFVNCRATFTLSFDEVKTSQEPGTDVSEAAPLALGNTTELRLEGTRLRNPGLAYVTLFSDVLAGGERLVRVPDDVSDTGDLGAVRVSYDPADPTAGYVSVRGF